MRDEVFKSWMKFVYWFVPIFVVLTFWLKGSGDGGWAISGGWFIAMFLFLLLILFFLVSLILIFGKRSSLQKSDIQK
jgi:uncharacterized membrane protein